MQNNEFWIKHPKNEYQVLNEETKTWQELMEVGKESSLMVLIDGNVIGNEPKIGAV